MAVSYDGPHLAHRGGMSDLSSTWVFARRMYESLRHTHLEPTARAYLEATARLIVARYSEDRKRAARA